MKSFLNPGLLIFFLYWATEPLFAQQTKQTSGSYTVVIEDYMSVNEAKRRAKDLAIVDAINNAFGTYVEQETNFTVQNGRSDFRIYANTKVKGDWIESIGNPEYKESVDQNKTKNGESPERSITCSIKGKVRELIPGPLIKCKTLRCPLIGCETIQFKSGDSLFVYFRSPINGYVAIFIEEGEVTRTLLPYRSSKENFSSCLQINENTDYFFFDRAKKDQPGVEGIELFTDNKGRDEDNVIHIIFSEKLFYKPTLNPEGKRTNGRIIPSSLSIEDFNSWLVHNRSIFTGFQDISIRISISPKQ